MSSNRKQQERDQRRSQRRGRRQQVRQGLPAEPIGQVQFTGPMGFMQRHTREFFVGGIIVMVLSVGSIFFGTQLGVTGGNDPVDDVAEADVDDGDETVSDDTTPDDGIVRVYEAPPEMTISTDMAYEAVIHLEGGDVRIELFADEAPGYVNNFIFLAQNEFFDGLTFHRVVPGFVAQAGDAGVGAPGYDLAEERNGLDFERGVLSMAKDSRGQVNGSQFFITLGSTPHLNGDFTVFGRVVEGLEIVESLTPRDPQEGPAEDGDTILGIDIIEQGA